MFRASHVRRSGSNPCPIGLRLIHLNLILVDYFGVCYPNSMVEHAFLAAQANTCSRTLHVLGAKPKERKGEKGRGRRGICILKCRYVNHLIN